MYKNLPKILGHTLLTVIGFWLFYIIQIHYLLMHLIWFSTPFIRMLIEHEETIHKEVRSFLTSLLIGTSIILTILIWVSPHRFFVDKFVIQHIPHYSYKISECVYDEPPSGTYSCRVENTSKVDWYWRLFLWVETWIAVILLLAGPIFTISPFKYPKKE